MAVDGWSITVGVDGSAESLSAAHWAAKEAELRGLSLLIVLVLNEPVEGHSDYVFPRPVVEAGRQDARNRLDRIVTSIRTAHPAIDVRTGLDHGDPRRVLVARSAQSRLTVVGTRGRGQIAEVLVGSVTMHVAAHAHSPVAVVPTTADGSAIGPVMLGVGGGTSGGVAAGYAFDEAAVRSTGLVAVLVRDEAEGWLADEGRPPVRPDEEQAREVLSRHLAPWREKYPAVAVREAIRRGRAAPALLAFLQEGPDVDRPRLVVIGTRGRGGLAGLFLGSTGQSLIAMSPVPVLVVPEGGHGERSETDGRHNEGGRP